MKDNLGDLIRVEERDKRLETKKVDEFWRWKQSKPLEEDKRDDEDEGHGLSSEGDEEDSLQVAETEL